MAKKNLSTLKQVIKSISSGKLKTETSMIEVEVMATAKGYAMVRRLGCAPFVASLKDLEPISGESK